MKRFILVLIAVGILLGGCAASKEGFSRRGPSWKNWDHFKYSWSGYKNPTVETGKMSEEQGWWGIPIEMENPK